MRLSEDEARQRFAAARVARLATLRHNTPRIVPIVFVLAGNTIYSAIDQKPKTTTQLRRLDDINTSPSVSILVDHYDEDWTQLWWVRADGVASVRGDDPVAIASLAGKYEQYRIKRPSGPVIAVEVQAWTGWSGAG